MKLLLLKILLQRRARDEGFTLPMVIALGLVMFLLGAINITAANEENITAISQNSRSDALAIAEIGVARYRELLDRNRILTIYDERLPTTAETAAGITNTQTKLWGRTDVCSSNLASFRQGATPQTIVDSQDLDNDGNTTENRGSYSLVSYDYSNGNGVLNLTDDTVNNNARGILTVKGTTPNGSEAQIKVEIPIRINLDDMPNLAPALWIGNKAISAANLSNLTIGNDSDSETDIDDDTIVSNDNGNVVIRDQAVTTGTISDGCRSFSTLASTSPRRPVISDSRDLPPITKIITDVASARSILTRPLPNTINPLPTTSSGQIIFGATSHNPYNPDTNTTNCPNIKLCRYYYEFGSTTSDLTSPSLTSTLVDTDLLTDGIAKTTLLLNQDLTIKATTKDVKVGNTSSLINDSNGFEIYVSGNHDITIDASGGNVTINGFLHAPQGKLKITGGGTVNINGSVWVNDFENTSATVNISPDTIKRLPTPLDPTTSGKAYKFYSTTNSRTARPLTGSPTNWKTEEVN